MTTTDTERIAARARLSERGWVPRRAESFRHLPPPAADAWLGDDARRARSAAPNAPARAGWLLAPVGSGSLGHVDARWLGTADPAERAALFADLPTSGEGDAAPFFWAHRALCESGLRLRIGSGSAQCPPLMLQLRLQPHASVEAPLVVIDVMPGARCVLIESHGHEAAGRNGPITQNLRAHIRLGAGASLYHLRVATPRALDRIAHHVHVQLECGAQYRQSLLAAGTEYHLQRTVLDLRGEHALARASGVLFASAHAKLEQQMRATHAAPRTKSAIDSLALASGNAQIVANAFSSIAAGASGADLRQRLSGIPTSGEPRVVLRPHLEIHHDDVQAAHGATWGALPEDALFYACQRGLDRRDARALIIAGMARSALARGIDAPGMLETLGGDTLVAREVERHLAEQAETTAATEVRHG
ncbi:SufD family Fe-S cluster assembly protein [Burkholderia sp. ABCPW 111]|uniref:SufD family Fe-S cluster assembly protein n=1 Tax=Burkholderia sp. ABCPW 111 TaxID=1820025 RepID=UPI00053142FC|nr:SufD family Fe-S cluster assembly protein [Burkholderia sp. ABCPW 111]KGR98399.1 hypothetical protein X946_4350 [Burkholderia sp. ABCPW 111]